MSISEAQKLKASGVEQELRFPPGITSFISNEQKEGVLKIHTTNDNMFVRLECGGGKSLVWSMPLAHAVCGVSIVILPYTQLGLDLQQTLDRFGYESMAFDISKGYFKCPSTSALPANLRFVLAVVETAMVKEFQDFMRGLWLRNLLNAVVIEEAHNILTQPSFRPLFSQLKYLSSFNTRLIFVSGTLPMPFQRKLLSDFLISPYSVSQVVRRTTYRSDRVVVSIVPLETAIHISTIATKIIQNKPTNRGVLVFSLTVECNDSLFNSFQRSLPEFHCVKLSGRSTREERQEFIRGFHHTSKPVVGFSTSCGAEGIDYHDLGMVIVIGGSWDGLIGFHQMSSRCARGSARGREPSEVILLYSYKLIQDYMGGHKNVISAREKDLSSFHFEDREEASRYVTLESLAKLNTSASQLRCSNKAMELALETYNGLETIPSCGQCNYCQGEAWRYARIIRDPTGFGRTVSSFFNPKGSVDIQELQEPRQESIVERFMEPLPTDQYAMKVQVQTFLISLMGKRTCALCIAPFICRTSRCSFLTSILSTQDIKCGFCTSLSHSYEEVSTKIRQISQKMPKDSVKDTQLKDPVIGSCAIVITDTHVWRRFRACRICCLQHEQHGKCEFEGQEVITNCIRSLLIHAWIKYQDELKNIFREGFTKGFGQFWQWCIYFGNSIQNAWLVLYFMLKQKLKKF
jgi:superfamily II DNA helicase RecQ